MTRTAEINTKEMEGKMEGKKIIDFPLKPVVEYDDNGRLVFARTVLFDGSIIEHHLDYDERGNLKSYSNSDGLTGEYIHNEHNAVSEFHGADGIIRMFEYDEHGNILKETDELGRVRAFNYIENTNEVLKIDFDGSEIKTGSGIIDTSDVSIDLNFTNSEINSPDDFEFTVTTEYLANGVIGAKIKKDRNKDIIDAIEYEYSKINGKLLIIKELRGTTESSYNDKIYHYDTNGNKVHEIINDEDFYYILDEKGNVLVVVSEYGYYCFNAYDQYSRQIYYQDSLGFTKWFTYLNPTPKDANDNNVLMYRETNYGFRKLIHHFYNDHGLEVKCQIIKDDRSVTEFEFDYNSDNTLASITDTVTREWSTYEYDDNGHCIRMLTSTGYEERRTFDGENIITFITSDGYSEENIWENGNLMKRKICGVPDIADFVQVFAYVGNSEVECHTYSI